MNPVLEKIYETGKVEGENGELFDAFPVSITEDRGVRLYNLVKSTSAIVTLETGMAYGISTLWIAQAHQDENIGGCHITIDPYQSTQWRNIGKLNLGRASLRNRVVTLEGRSCFELPRLLLRTKEMYFIDLILIDGCHSFDYALVDFFYSDLLLKEGGILFLDDIWMPPVRKVLDFVVRNRKYSVIDQSNIYAVLKKMENDYCPEEREFWFEDF